MDWSNIEEVRKYKRDYAGEYAKRPGVRDKKLKYNKLDYVRYY